MLGETPLMGVLTGQLALEVHGQELQPTCRIWTLYDCSESDVLTRIRNSYAKVSQITPSVATPSTFLPYSRICADAPVAALPSKPLQFWLEPNDELTQASCLGSQWLEPLNFAPRNGLILAQLNRHMLNADCMRALQTAGLLSDHENLKGHWIDPVSAGALG